jgi:hypothetical protein
MGPIRCPETSVNNYHTMPCNYPEDHRFHQHRGGSLISRRLFVSLDKQIWMPYRLGYKCLPDNYVAIFQLSGLDEYSFTSHVSVIGRVVTIFTRCPTVSFIGVLPASCATLYYMLDAQNCYRPQRMPHREQSRNNGSGDVPCLVTVAIGVIHSLVHWHSGIVWSILQI